MIDYLKKVVTGMIVLSVAALSGCADKDFVGGVVVANKQPISLFETYSQKQFDIPPNPDGQTLFTLNDIYPGAPFDFTLLKTGEADCSITNGSGLYGDFPNFSVKVQCRDDEDKRWSGNPIIRHQYTADPTVVVEGEYLYLYAGRDETSFLHVQKRHCGTRCTQEALQLIGNFDITGIHVYRTSNMVDWEYMGPAIQAQDVRWMRQTWASHILKKNGKYYLFTCSPAFDVIADVSWKSIRSFLNGGSMALGPSALTGVAVSDTPTGPFIDKGSPLVSHQTPDAIDGVMDPTAFTDVDGTTYLFYGGGGKAQYVALSDDLLSIKGPLMEITGVAGSDPIPGFTEALHIHEHDNLYYLTYSKSKAGSPPGPLAYATADNIHGPWTYRGDFLGAVDVISNHGAIAEFKGKHYVFYHTGQLPGIHAGSLTSNATRAVSVQQLTYTEDGLIEFVIQSAKGVQEVD